MTELHPPRIETLRKVLTNGHFKGIDSTYGLSHSLLKHSNPNTLYIFKNQRIQLGHYAH